MTLFRDTRVDHEPVPIGQITEKALTRQAQLQGVPRELIAARAIQLYDHIMEVLTFENTVLVYRERKRPNVLLHRTFLRKLIRILPGHNPNPQYGLDIGPRSEEVDTAALWSELLDGDDGS